MADYEKLQQKEIILDLDGIPKEQQSEVKDAVGEYLLNSILDTVAGGQSPVAGAKPFKKLSKKYAEREKDGDTNPNLYLLGDMLGSLDYKYTSKGLAIGIMDDSQRPKADGHNNFSGDSKLPQRRFIPGESQTFKSEIIDGVNDIVSQYKTDAEAEAQVKADLEDLQATQEGISTNLFSNESIADILLKRLLR
jgi:hypothetical protein